MARRPTPMKDLFSMVNARQRATFYELLIKIKRMYRNRICNALIVYITQGTTVKFSDTWLDRWYKALLLDIKTTDKINKRINRGVSPRLSS